MSDSQATRALSEALRLVAAGYQLSPVTIHRRPDGKKGFTFHQRWRHESGWSADADQVRAWWVDHPDTSFALRTGHAGGVDVIDLDVSDGHDAVTWWAQQGHPLGSLIVTTPSGGLHSYVPACGLPTNAGRFAPGVDTRGDGGLVIAPGGYVLGEEGGYEVQGRLAPVAELAPLSPELVEAIRSADVETGQAYRADGQIQLKDRAVIMQKCREQVEALAALPPRTGGSAFRNAQMGAAMMLGRLVEAGAADVGWAREKLEEATRAVWSSLDADDVANIESGLRDGPRKERWRFREEAPAIAAPTSGSAVPAAHEAAQVHAVVDPPADRVLRAVGEDEGWDAAAAADAVDRAEVDAILRRRRWQRMADELERTPVPALDELAVWDDDLESLPAPTMAIKHLIPERAVGWLGGPSGSYKSFVAVSLAASLAYGVPALEQAMFAPRTRRRVLYVAGEGSSGVALRLRALRARQGVTAARQLVLYPRAVDLTSEAAVTRMTDFALAYQVEHVVIDTFRQSTLGVQENDNTEVGAVLGRLLALRDEHGISSTLVDHTNKSAQGLADLGGAGAKRANADYVLMIDLPNGSRASDQQRTLRVAKLKDSPDGQTWPIRLERVEDVVDGEGTPQAVAVVGEVDRTAAEGEIHGDDDWREVPVPGVVREWTGTGRQDLSRVAQLVAHYGSGETGISRAEVARYFRADTPGVSAEACKKRVGRAWDALHALGLLKPVSARAGSPAGAHRWVSTP